MCMVMSNEKALERQYLGGGGGGGGGRGDLYSLKE